MRQVIVMAVACLSLCGCASFSMDSFRSAPPPVNVQFDSIPPGAEARTSLGPSCKTPCSLPVNAEGGFSVTYTLNKYQPLTVPVQVIRNPGDFTTAATTVIEPNPVVAELQPLKPPRRAVRKMLKKRAPAAATAAAPAAGSPFPAPNR